MILGVDIGGTFTDVVLLDRQDARLLTWKVLTTPQAPEEGVLLGVSEILAANGYDPGAVEAVVHATTLVTNAIIERKGEPTALITTRGFKDVLEMGRELRYDLYDLDPGFPEPLVARTARLEISARGDARGAVVHAVDRGELTQAMEALDSLGLRSVAVNLLHSYAVPELEEEVGAWMAANAPHITVSLSSDVAREIGEYERGSTVVANGYVKALIVRYLRKLREGLQEGGLRAPLLVMHSAGGFCSTEVAGRYPIRLLESGPAAGALAAAYAGSSVGQDGLIGFDMGGTTAKACLIRDGAPDITFRFEAGRVHRFKRGSGLPILTPSIDLIEIGAGGGSIAAADSLGLLQVGPESSGSEPGPACYDRGGAQPTVTDADLVLGYLAPGSFLGGRMALSVLRAEAAIQERLANPLGLTVLEAAWGIHQVVNENMATAARVYLAEKAADPRKLTMVATGGAGPVHAFGVARSLGCQQVLYPPAAGVGSAVGLLVAPAREDEVMPFAVALRLMENAELLTALRSLEARARGRMGERPESQAAVTTEFSADMRYIGQGQWVNVPLDLRELEREAPAQEAIAEAFRLRYQKLFGKMLPEAGVEFVNLRMVAQDKAPAPRLDFVDLSGATAASSTRPIYVVEGHGGGVQHVPVYQRPTLAAGTVLRGPCVIEEAATTIVVNAQAEIVVDAELNVVVCVPARSSRESTGALGRPPYSVSVGAQP